ncbi:MAG TPA: hypothetical protein VN704_01085 [Verrucomicrobiae bacterium]|nr:hypothetical protein [Verrucomicrobiae bacterium]
MASSNNFAIEKGKSANAIEWIKNYTDKNNKSFKISTSKHSIDTLNFGSFDLIEWEGDWNIARSIFKRVSSKLNIKVVESGYHKKGNIVEAFFGISTEYGKVYSSGKYIGVITFTKKSGKWVAGKEKRG